MKRAAFVTSMVFGALSFLGTLTFAQSRGVFSFTQFSATLVEHDADNTVHTAKLYRLGDRMRSESAEMGQGAYFLSLLGQNTGYLVGSGFCMEGHSIDPEHPNPFDVAGKTEKKELGAEVIDGHPTKIEEITFASAAGKPVTLKAWEATDLKGFPVRIEMPTPKGTMQMNFKDIDLSAPAASLFVTPKGCSPMPTSN